MNCQGQPTAMKYWMTCVAWTVQVYNDIVMSNAEKIMDHVMHGVNHGLAPRVEGHTDGTVYNHQKMRARLSAVDLEMDGVVTVLATGCLPISDGSKDAHVVFADKNYRELSYAASLLHKGGLLPCATQENRDPFFSDTALSGMVPDGHKVEACMFEQCHVKAKKESLKPEDVVPELVEPRRWVQSCTIEQMAACVSHDMWGACRLSIVCRGQHIKQGP